MSQNQVVEFTPQHHKFKEVLQNSKRFKASEVPLPHYIVEYKEEDDLGKLIPTYSSALISICHSKLASGEIPPYVTPTIHFAPIDSDDTNRLTIYAIMNVHESNANAYFQHVKNFMRMRQLAEQKKNKKDDEDDDEGDNITFKFDHSGINKEIKENYIEECEEEEEGVEKVDCISLPKIGVSLISGHEKLEELNVSAIKELQKRTFLQKVKSFFRTFFSTFIKPIPFFVLFSTLSSAVAFETQITSFLSGTAMAPLYILAYIGLVIFSLFMCSVSFKSMIRTYIEENKNYCLKYKPTWEKAKE